MADAETRALGRAALLLLAASVVRLAWGAPAPEPPPGGSDALPELLAASRDRAEQEEARGKPLRAGERLDPNRASAVELDRLPGVGPATAEALVRDREAVGPYRTAEDLLRVRGVGPALLARLRPLLDLSDPPPGRPGRSGAGGREATAGRGGPGGGGGVARAPVDLNRADTTALQSLPGVGPALARRIVEARRETPFSSVDDLLRVRGIGPVLLARLKPLVMTTP